MVSSDHDGVTVRGDPDQWQPGPDSDCNPLCWFTPAPVPAWPDSDCNFDQSCNFHHRSLMMLTSGSTLTRIWSRGRLPVTREYQWTVTARACWAAGQPLHKALPVRAALTVTASASESLDRCHLVKGGRTPSPPRPTCCGPARGNSTRCGQLLLTHNTEHLITRLGPKQPDSEVTQSVQLHFVSIFYSYTGTMKIWASSPFPSSSSFNPRADSAAQWPYEDPLARRFRLRAQSISRPHFFFS